MKHEEMLKINSINVFNEISNGISTVLEISKRLGISHTTVEKVCDDLTKRKFIKTYTEKQGTPGRRKVKYAVSDLHYCVYVEESKECFSCIFINTELYAIERFDKIKFVYTIPLSEVVQRVVRSITLRDDYKKFCHGVYVSCYEESAPLFPKEFNIINKEEFIANSLKTDNEILLFEFPQKCILSVYGNIIHTNAKRKGIEHVFTPNKIITLKKPYFEEIFSSLKACAIENMKKKL